MTLSDLVARLGIAELARRAGVTPTTLKRWLMHGASARGAGVLAGILRRHEASSKAAATTKAKRQAPWKTPPEADLPAGQVLPTRTPTEREKKAALRAEDLGVATKQPIDSIYSIGDIEWVTIGKQIGEVETNEIVDIAWEIFQNSDRNFLQVKFLLFRYTPPFSHLYRGGMTKKNGVWEEWWIQTKAQQALQSFSNNVDYVLDLALKAAKTRVIYLEVIGVLTFDHRSQLELTRPLRRR